MFICFYVRYDDTSHVVKYHGPNTPNKTSSLDNHNRCINMATKKTQDKQEKPTHLPDNRHHTLWIHLWSAESIKPQPHVHGHKPTHEPQRVACSCASPVIHSDAGGHALTGGRLKPQHMWLGLSAGVNAGRTV